MESAPADVLTGRTLDRRYHVRSRIAHGGMATVYLATDIRLDREVALKVMHADLTRDGDFVGRFIGEAKSVAKLSHPNIVGVYDQGADGQYLYLAMEYVPGRTLRALLRERGWLPPAEALAVMDPVLAGLAAAHKAGIVHRDVKPENVLITDDGRVKVVDFGLARASAAVSHTRAGLIIGSVAYIAPEQVTGEPTDARTDVYAAGIMLFELLTGRQPFTGETPLAVAYAHVNSDVPPVSALAGGIPPSVDQLVGAATSRDPRLRPADAGVFLRVTRVLRGIGEAAPSDAAPTVWGMAAGSPGLLDVPGAAGTAGGAAPARYDATAAAPGGSGSHTMVVDAGYHGYDRGGYAGERYDAGYGPLLGPGGAADDDGGPGGEPFLQRWLFSRRFVYLLAALVILAGLGGGSWWLTSGRYTPVPVVTDKTAAAAARVLEQAGFQVRDGSTVTDDNVPKGEVVSAAPSGRALRGATITLTLSSGPKMITVPPVPTTDTVAQARAALRAAGLTVAPATKKVGVASNPVVGTVAGTDPAAGTSVAENKPVTIEEVAGLSLPSLVNQNISAVQQWASQNQLNLQMTQVSSTTVAQGTIVAQSPAPGTVVTAGQTVTVQVSSGPPEVTIPSVQGLNCQQAQQALQSAGFNVSLQQSFFHRNQVSGTNPTGQAPGGTTVVLMCGSNNPF